MEQLDYDMDSDLYPRSEIGPGEGSQTVVDPTIGFVPQVDTPLRATPPTSINAPLRAHEMSRDQNIHDTAFSPEAFMDRSNGLPFQLQAEGTAGLVRTLKKKGGAAVKTHTENQSPYRNKISDYAMLAFSSQRAGCDDMEGLAHYSMGVVWDNMAQYGKALDAYTRFLDVCKRTGNKEAEALCLNCIGVAYMHVGVAVKSPPCSVAEGLTPQRRRSLQRALDFHKAHLEIAEEDEQWVAHTNIGLCLGMLAGAASADAANHHQEALRVSLEQQDAAGQAVAVGNLGILAMRQGGAANAANAENCLLQHLRLVQDLCNAEAEVGALMHLGDLHASRGDHEKALEMFEKASQVAQTQGAVSTYKRITCSVGLAKGRLTMDDYFNDLAAKVLPTVK